MTKNEEPNEQQTKTAIHSPAKRQHKHHTTATRNKHQTQKMRRRTNAITQTTLPITKQDLDVDEDAKLTKEEVLAFFKKQGRDELPEGLWEKEDKNEDGVISWEEFSGPKGKTAPPLKDEV